MTGWRTQVSGEYEPAKGVVGIVVAPKFPDLDLIREKINEGIARVPAETVWVIREKRQRNHAVNAVWDALEAAGIEPILAPLVPAWASKEQIRETQIAVPARLDECEQAGTWLTFEEPFGKDYDLRRRWADAELGNTCERVIVFHDASSQVTAGWADPEHHCTAKVFVIERGKKRAAPKRRGRKPVGV